MTGGWPGSQTMGSIWESGGVLDDELAYELENENTTL